MQSQQTMGLLPIVVTSKTLESFYRTPFTNKLVHNHWKSTTPKNFLERFTSVLTYNS